MAINSLKGLTGQLTIDLGAIVKNYQALNAISANSLTGAVVKADAYGCGMLPVASVLYQAGARFFFVATPSEAIVLRAELKDAHIFVFNGLYPNSAKLYVEQRIMPILNSAQMLEEWLSFCIANNELFPAAIHFDTGMGRLGIKMNEVDWVKDKISQVGFLPQMIMSHLACADILGHEKNRMQLIFFKAIAKQFPNIPFSLANSAGIMSGRANHFQMVRPGIALYGGRAINGKPNPMKPVVNLKVPVLQVFDAKAGETIGYGATYTIDRNSKIAILALGYADGFLRSLSGTNSRHGGRILINNKILPVIGRVSMDLIAVDVTQLHGLGPNPGDMVEVLGNIISIDDQADLAGTIGYEILTSLKGRYNKSYILPNERKNGGGVGIRSVSDQRRQE